MLMMAGKRYLAHLTLDNTLFLQNLSYRQDRGYSRDWCVNKEIRQISGIQFN